MDSDTIYETCLPILQDPSLEEEDKTDKLEDLVRKETSLSGKSLENTVLDVLWRYRNASTPSTSPTVRHTVVRRNSPAPWQASRSGTPVAGSPVPSMRSAAASPAPQVGGAASLGVRPALLRMTSSYRNQSPFTSPRPSPRPTYLAPYASPGSKMGFEYEHNGSAPSSSLYDDYDPMDWPGSDDGASIGSGYAGEANEYLQPQMVEMSPYDILRSVLRDEKSDQEIEQILEVNGYDLSAAIASLMEGQGIQTSETSPEMGAGQQQKTFLVGKSMNAARPVTPVGQAKTPVVCRYWLSTGQCLRADCRFSHDLSNVVCKYWLAGQCLAGDSCIFSHDPSSLMGSMSLSSEYSASPPQADYQLQDYSSFPSLSSSSHATPGMESPLRNLYASNSTIAPPPGFSPRPTALAPEFVPSRPHSRPSSSKGLGSSVDESEAFPSLGAAALRGGRKHHGKRGHGHAHKEKEPSGSSSLADIVRNSPAPNPVQSPRRSLRNPGSYSGTRENSAAALAIPAPEHVPWLETGERANQAYLKARAEAIKHGGARNKFLQSAAQAWNRNDVRAARTLSLRGQNENDLMRAAHRVAAAALYDERNPHLAASPTNTDDELFIDLHGLHPAESVSYLASALSARRASARLVPSGGENSKRHILYAIVGTGTHSKNGRDKVGKAVRAYLNECRYAFREFGTPADGSAGTRGVETVRGVGSTTGGGILGIDCESADVGKVRSVDAKAVGEAVEKEESGGGLGLDGEIGVDVDGIGEGGVIGEGIGVEKLQDQLQQGKIRILKAEDVKVGVGLGS